MNWKVIVSGIVAFLLMTSSGLGKDNKQRGSERFAQKIRQIILNKDIKAYYRLHTKIFFKTDGKLDALGVTLEKEYRDYIFGNDKDKFSIRNFFLKQNYVSYIKRYGKSNEYTLIFYDPRKIDFPNKHSDFFLWQCWQKCYVQTFIYFIDGKWRLKNTSFYFGLIVPGSGEYG